MATATIIKRHPGCWVGPAGDASFISSLLSFDATIKEVHRGRNVITRQPVERGVDISDHVRPEPDEIVLEAIVSNSPIDPDLIALGALNDSAAATAYQTLLDLKTKASFLTVSTALRDYDNMIISSVDVDRDKTSGQILSAKIGFQSVLTVESQTVALPAKPAGSAKKKAGTKPTTDQAAAAQTRTSDLLHIGQALLK